MNEFIKVDRWVREIIVDPLSKEKMVEADEFLLSPYGRKYPITDGIWDLRLLNNVTTQDQQRWKQGQDHYEQRSLAQRTKVKHQNYVSKIEGVKDVYAAIPVEGRCLDVGGHQGRLRMFLSPDQEYISCDPFLHVFNGIYKGDALTQAYSCLLEPVNFVCCDAEFLPFCSSSFQTVHMRSVLDHFLNPELAINEAYRVLEDDGYLVIGLYISGGKAGRLSMKEQAKHLIKRGLESTGVSKYKDHHVWHPTFRQLVDLVSHCGFEIVKEHWQERAPSVCYLRCDKRRGLRRQG